MSATTKNAEHKPNPYRINPDVCVSTFGDDRHGKYGGWVSIAGEWVRLETEEIHRLMKKREQARELRLQWEKESGMTAR